MQALAQTFLRLSQPQAGCGAGRDFPGPTGCGGCGWPHPASLLPRLHPCWGWSIVSSAAPPHWGFSDARRRISRQSKVSQLVVTHGLLGLTLEGGRKDRGWVLEGRMGTSTCTLCSLCPPRRPSRAADAKRVARPQGDGCHVPFGRQDSSRHIVLSVSRSPLVSIISHFQDSAARRPAIHARLESRCCLQRARI